MQGTRWESAGTLFTRTENPRVAGSIPALGTTRLFVTYCFYWLFEKFGKYRNPTPTRSLRFRLSISAIRCLAEFGSIISDYFKLTQFCHFRLLAEQVQGAEYGHPTRYGTL